MIEIGILLATYIGIIVVFAATGLAVVALSMLMGNSLSGKKGQQSLARLHLRLASIAWGRAMALIWRSNGMYDLVPMRVEEDEITIYLDGNWQPVEYEGQLERFLGGWITELVERGDQINPYLDNQSENVDSVSIANQTYYRYNPYPDADGPLVSIPKFWKPLKGHNMSSQAIKGIERGLEEAGNLGKLSPTMWVVMSIGGILIGGVLGLIVAVL